MILINWFPQYLKCRKRRQGRVKRQQPYQVCIAFNVFQMMAQDGSQKVHCSWLPGTGSHTSSWCHVSLRWMNIECPSCGSLHWMVEKKSSSSKSSPRFSICCSDGRVSLSLLQPPPEPLQSLLTSMNCPAVKFWEDIWKYNCADKGHIGLYTKLCDFTLLFMILQVELRLNKDH